MRERFDRRWNSVPRQGSREPLGFWREGRAVTTTVPQDRYLPRESSVRVSAVQSVLSVLITVVSYVVNNGPLGVAPATAERVRESMCVLGYQPNFNARALKRGSDQTIG